MHLSPRVLVPLIVVVVSIAGLFCFMVAIISVRRLLHRRPQQRTGDPEWHPPITKKLVLRGGRTVPVTTSQGPGKYRDTKESRDLGMGRSSGPAHIGGASTWVEISANNNSSTRPAHHSKCPCQPRRRESKSEKASRLGLSVFIREPARQPEKVHSLRRGSAMPEMTESNIKPRLVSLRQPARAYTRDQAIPARQTSTQLPRHSHPSAERQRSHPRAQPARQDGDFFALPYQGTRTYSARGLPKIKTHTESPLRNVLSPGPTITRKPAPNVRRVSDINRSLPMLPTLPQTKIEIPLSLSAKTPNVHKAKDLLNKSLPPSPHSSRIASPVSPEYENTRHGRQAPDTKSSTGLSTRFPSSPILPNIPKLPVLKVPSPKDVSAVERTKSNSRRRPPAPPPSPSPRTPPTSPNVDQASPTSSVSPGSSNVSYPSSAYTVVRRVPILSGRSRPPLTRLNSLPRKPLPALDARVFDAYSGTRLHLENPRPDMNSGNNSPESNKTGSSKSISKKRTPI